MNKNQFPLIVHETAAAWRNVLDKKLKPLGLSQAKWRALFHLAMADAPLTQTQLAKKLSLEPATIVGLVDRLSKEKWVKRETNADDRRIKVIHLTEKAQSILEQMKNIANQLCAEILTPLSQEELEACIATLKKIKHLAEECNE